MSVAEQRGGVSARVDRRELVERIGKVSTVDAADLIRKVSAPELDFNSEFDGVPLLDGIVFSHPTIQTAFYLTLKTLVEKGRPLFLATTISILKSSRIREAEFSLSRESPDEIDSLPLRALFQEEQTLLEQKGLYLAVAWLLSDSDRAIFKEKAAFFFFGMKASRLFDLKKCSFEISKERPALTLKELLELRDFESEALERRVRAFRAGSAIASQRPLIRRAETALEALAATLTDEELLEESWSLLCRHASEVPPEKALDLKKSSEEVLFSIWRALPEKPKRVPKAIQPKVAEFLLKKRADRSRSQRLL